MQKLFTFLIGIFIFITTSAQSPQLIWAKSFNGNSASTDSTSLIKMNISDNSVYIAGTSDAYGNGNDIVLIKRDCATGDTLWTRQYNGPANSDDQAVDLEINQTTGDIYVTGKSIGNSTGYDIVTIKYSSDGTLEWSKRWDNSDYHGDDIPVDIGIDNSGKIFVSGRTFNGESGLFPRFNDVIVLEYNSESSLTNFNIVNVGTNYDDNLVQDAIVNSSGDVIVAGESMVGTKTNGYSTSFVGGFKSNLSSFYPPNSWSGTGPAFVGTTLNTNGWISAPDDFNYYNAMDMDNSKNIYIATLGDTIWKTGSYYQILFEKINSSGTVVWKRKTGGNAIFSNLKVNDLKIDANSLNMYAAGYELNEIGNFDWFVIKYNSSGMFQWRVTKKGTGNGNDIAFQIAFDEFQNPIVIGVTKNSGTNNDITFVKYNKTNGSEIYSVNYDLNNGDEKAYNIIVDASQRIIINGIVNTDTQGQNMITLMYCNTPPTPTISLNEDALHSDATTGNQWYNKNELIIGATTQYYTPKINGEYYVIVSVNGCTSNHSNTIHFIPTGINSTESSKLVKVYPNPVNNELTIELEGNSIQANFVILNSLGQAIYSGTIFEKVIIPTSSFTPGVYLIKLETGKLFEFNKIIKQ